MTKMKRLLCLATALLLLLTATAFAEDAKTPMGTPDMTLTDKDGNEVRLYDFAGKPVIINFWATWCPWCVYEFPAYQALYEAYGDRIAFLMVDECDGYSETREKALQYVQENGYTFPVYFDEGKNYPYMNYGWTGIPGSVFINADGTVLDAQLGAMNEGDLNRMAAALLGEEQSAALSAPDMELETRQGEKVRLWDLAGKPMVINFWASWCPWCLHEFPAFEKMYQQYGDQVNFVMVDWCDGSAETREKAEDLLDLLKFTFPVYYDMQNQSNTLYGLTGLPCTFFLYADGSLYMKKAGAMDAAGLEAALQTVIAGK